MPAFGATASVHSETGGVAEKRVKTDRLWPAVLDNCSRQRLSTAAIDGHQIPSTSERDSLTVQSAKQAAEKAPTVTRRSCVVINQGKRRTRKAANRTAFTKLNNPSVNRALPRRGIARRSERGHPFRAH
jgi:hypothetical protein